MGPPLSARDADDTNAQLDAWMHALEELLTQLYGTGEPAMQARMEFERLAKLGGSQDELFCKRAALLFALLHEKEVGHAMGDEDAVARDMRARVLPFEPRQQRVLFVPAPTQSVPLRPRPGETVVFSGRF